MTRQANSLDLFLGDFFNFVMERITPYFDKIKERQKIMREAQEKRTAPLKYLKILQEISPKHPDDWRAGDICFLDQYKKDSELHEKLLEVREYYFSNHQKQ